MIRLQRMGTHKKPTYRLVISEKTKSTKSNVLEILGMYNPHTKEFNSKEDRIKYWISVGAQCSATINNLLIDKGIKKGEKVKSWIAKKKEKPAEEKK